MSPAAHHRQPVLHILYSPPHTLIQSSQEFKVLYRPSISPLYDTDPLRVLRIFYSPLQAQYQSSVYTTGPYRPRYCPRYNLQSTTDPVPVLRLLCSPIRPSISPPYNPRSTTEPVPLLRIKYSPIQIQYLSIVYIAV